MRFHIKEWAWSLPEPFVVSNDAGSTVFEVRGTFATIDDDLLVDHSTGQELASPSSVKSGSKPGIP